MHQFSALFALPYFLRLSAARAVWIPEQLKENAAFWIAEDFIPLARRDDTCGGHDGYNPCGDGFALDFCCPTGARCLALSTASNIHAALCCPAGQACQTINPISCDTTLQNATLNPTSQLHSDPPTELEKCGSSCCPMGYQCQGTNCVALTAGEVAASPSPSASSMLPTAPTASVSPTSASGSTDGVTITSVPSSEPSDNSGSGSDGFSGKSFAAGFVPGIAIGALIAAGLIIFVLRKERKKSRSYVDEKYHSSRRDTLTDLGTESPWRPTVHGRSISEPTVDTSLGHRTDFLQCTPPREADQRNPSGMQGYIVNVQSPSTAAHTNEEASHDRGWLSRSPFTGSARTPVPTQSPVPAHLKRGTLSFHISPIRALKKQKSMHSLRRQMTDLGNRSNSATRRQSPERSQSTETIKVLMDTPATQSHAPTSTLPSSAHHPQPGQPSASVATWETTYTSDSDGATPIEEEPNTYTPTRPGRNSNIAQVGATLNSPYTPSNYPPKKDAGISKIPLSSLLAPEKSTQNTRDSTFSAIMEKVGLRKTLLMGPDPKGSNQK